jgi:glucose/arabinose dehydrogenase
MVAARVHARAVKSLLVAAFVVLASCGSAAALRSGPAPSPALASQAPARAAAGPSTVRNTPLQVVASGLGIPTAFAFGAGHVFESDDGNGAGTQRGGVFILSHGRGQRLPGSPSAAYGLAWHDGWLYVSAVNRLLRWGGFNGSRFTVRQTLYTQPPGASGLNGIAFGANGRLYVGVSTGPYDHGPTHKPYALDLLTFNATGSDLRVFARGIRQPWQMAFPPGSSSPFMSDLSQDQGAVKPPDFLLRVHQGDNFGFWRCNWTPGSPCGGYTRPLVAFRAHTDPMGLGIIGSRLYLAESGARYPPLVVSMNFAGHGLHTEAQGFPAAIVGLAVHAGWIYVGAGDGSVWRFRPGR